MKKRLALAGCAASALLGTASYASYRLNGTSPASHGANASAWATRNSPALGESTTALAPAPSLLAPGHAQAAGLVGVDDLIYGYSNPAQVTWAAQGKFKASMYCSDGTRLRDSSYVPPANTSLSANSQNIDNHRASSLIDIPQLAVTTKGVTQTYAGYGRRVIHGANGIDVTLALQPMQTHEAAPPLKSLKLIDTVASTESAQSEKSSANQRNGATPAGSNQMMSDVDANRLEAQMQALDANQKLQSYGAENKAEIKRLQQQISQSILNSPEMKQLRSPEYQKRLTEQIEQQTLDSPEIKRLQSPEFQKTLRQQIMDSPGMKYLQSPEFKKQLQEQLKAAQQPAF